MVRGPADSGVPPDRVELRVQRGTAREKIEAHVVKGEALLARMSNASDFAPKEQEYHRWDTYAYELLGSLFTADRYASEYRGFGGQRCTYRNLAEQIDSCRDGLNHYIHQLRSILDRLDLIPESPFVARSLDVSEATPLGASNKVFIVHGHDDLAKQTAARFVERLGLTAIILHEQINSGKTVIEKVEEHSEVAFAIILHTPDDVGNSKADKEAKKPLTGRSRQNVVFEHGYFVGKLGRERVAALVKGEIEIPSDLSGVVYIPMDEPGAWKAKIAGEMNSAGLAVNLKALLS